MQDPDLKCSHFGILWHFMVFWHFMAFYGILAFLPKSLIRNQTDFSEFIRFLDFFLTFRLFDYTTLPKIRCQSCKIR